MQQRICQWMTGIRFAHLAIILALAGLAILPLHSFVGTETSLVARLLVTGMLVLAVTRPNHALLVCAGLTPLAGPLGALLGSSVSLTEALVLAFLGGWLLHEGVRPTRAERASPLAVTPAILFGGAVAASCAAQMMVLQLSVDYAGPFLRQVVEFLWRDYCFDPARFRPVAASMLLLEGTALFVAVVTLARRDASLAGKVARMVAAAGAGVAALNINRLLAVSLRSGLSLKELAAGASAVRISSVFPDVNAAGSYLVMVLLLSGALAIGGRRLRAGWIVATCLVLGALWLAGSRVGIVAAPAVVVFMFALRGFRQRAWVRPVLVGAVAVVLVGFAVAYVSRDGQSPLRTAARIRVELVGTGLRMFATHPVFGVGVGRFYSLSSEFSSPELRRIYPRENAHNNFLQILAELGIVGFAAFSWLLVAVGRHARQALVSSRAGPVLIGATGGLVAFLLTCLAGHPLLIREVAYAFWLVLGLAAALALGDPAPADDQRATGRWFSRHRLGCATTLLLAVSVPIQGRLMLAEADLEHAAIGFSAWQTDSEGVRFRWMAEHAQFYVSSKARAVKLPLRLEAAGTAASWPVEIYLEGRLGTRILVESRAWHEVRLMMPQAQRGRRFWRVELRVPPVHTDGRAPDHRPTAAPPRIQVGRPELTPPPS